MMDEDIRVIEENDRILQQAGRSGNVSAVLLGQFMGVLADQFGRNAAVFQFRQLQCTRNAEDFVLPDEGVDPYIIVLLSAKLYKTLTSAIPPSLHHHHTWSSLLAVPLTSLAGEVGVEEGAVGRVSRVEGREFGLIFLVSGVSKQGLAPKLRLRGLACQIIEAALVVVQVMFELFEDVFTHHKAFLLPSTKHLHQFSNKYIANHAAVRKKVLLKTLSIQ